MSDPHSYDSYIARAMVTPGGHLFLGRGGGFSLAYEGDYGGAASLSGWDCETVEAAAIKAGLPVIDSRDVDFDLVVLLELKGPMVAVAQESSPRPWHGLSYAPLAAVAAAYRKAGAKIHNVPVDPQYDGVLDEVAGR
jgi:hypothetical protein